jgi:phage tail sheath protein FI
MTISESTGAPPIMAADTAIAAFVGRAKLGPVNEPVRVRSFGEFERSFGGLWSGSTLGYAVSQFFQNGGAVALIVRIGGTDGSSISDDDISAPALASRKLGLWALEKADLFNLLCIPPLTPAGEIGRQTREAAANYCATRRALFIVDPPAAWTSAGAALSGVDTLVTRTANAAVYFPRLRAPDSLQGGAATDFAPCGAIAGIIARTDSARGVWKAPAGVDAALEGVAGLSVALTDADIGSLNPLGVNCLRATPAFGPVIWGARTFSDDPQYKYVPVRRLVLFIEESLFRGTKWAVFEPNAEPLWAQLRLSVGAFLNDLFRQGAFPAPTPQGAYFVKCDRTTMTQSDIDGGNLIIVVGIAPVRPAEFVIITIRQTTS